MDELEKMCNLHYKYVKSYALSLCLNETLAEDITQETFYNAIKKIVIITDGMFTENFTLSEPDDMEIYVAITAIANSMIEANDATSSLSVTVRVFDELYRATEKLNKSA